MSQNENVQVQTYWIAMRDSVRLATDIYRPDDSTPRATILIRTAEDRKKYARPADYFVQHGYTVAVQSMRGRFGSEGQDSLFWNDGWGLRQDGYDTVEWLARQTWCDGKIGTFGAGEAGFAQYLLSASSPPHLITQYVISAPYSIFRNTAFQNGAFRKELIENWLASLQASQMVQLFVQHPQYGSFWYPVEPSRRAEQVNVPITHLGGWFDAFAPGILAAFQNIQRRATKFARQNQRLIIGPWSYGLQGIGKRQQGQLIFPENAQFDLFADATRWFDQWLKAADMGLLLEPPVKYYLMGDVEDRYAPGNTWKTAKTWPPAHQRVRYYLKKNGELGAGKPDKKTTAEGFRYNPNDPLSTVGGANFARDSGPYDQRTVELRDNVLIFTTPPLDQPLAIAGPARLKLYAESTVYDTDFTAKLTDVYPDGRSMLVVDGILRARNRHSLVKEKLLQPGKIETFWIELGSTAIAFNKGHRIRLAISSSNSPRFEPNPNSPLPFRRQKRMQIAVNTIYYGGKKRSFLELPVIAIE